MTPTSSPWTIDNPARAAAPLAGDTRYDVCVVGGGIAGLTAAYLLADAGKSVVVLDAKSKVAAGETEYTTAHLAWVIDDRFTRVAEVRGDDNAKLAAESHQSAIDLIEQIAKREKIACEFKRVDGYLFSGKDGPEALRDEMVTATRLMLPFERVERLPFAGAPVGPAMRFPDNAQFHPLKYLSDLAAVIRMKGGVIHTDTRVVNIDSGSPCCVHTNDKRKVTADAVVVATGSPFDVGVTTHLKVAAYMTYSLAFEVPAASVKHALYWDTEDPYHYVRLSPSSNGNDLLIVGGEDHKTGQADDQKDRWARLEAWTRERFPQAGAVKHHWSGQVFETPDGLGFSGLAPGWRNNVYVITGDSGMGITHGTLGARLVSDLILGRTNPYAGLYSPSRWAPAALKTLLEENANIAAQYTDWLTGGEVSSADDIPNGQGAVVRRGLTKLAIYKDDDGAVHELSAVCPHLGGIVQWNPGEQTWDCPCHGSRFRCTGEMMHGPAASDLTPVEQPETAGAK